MEAISALNVSDVMEQIDSYDVVGIDEGQFVSRLALATTPDISI